MGFYSSLNKIRPMVNIYVLSYNINYVQSIVTIMNFKPAEAAVFNVLFKWNFKSR